MPRSRSSGPAGARPSDGQRHLASKRIKRLAQDGGCVDDESLKRDHRLRSAFHGGVARHLEMADHLNGARAGFGSRIGLTTQHRSRRAFGIEGTAFAMLMAELAIGTVHVDDGMTARLQEARQTCPEEPVPSTPKAWIVPNLSAQA